MRVFVCSNRECVTVFDFDPRGHCPICIKPDGSGWSTIATDVRTAEDVVQEIRARKVDAALARV